MIVFRLCATACMASRVRVLIGTCWYPHEENVHAYIFPKASRGTIAMLFVKSTNLRIEEQRHCETVCCYLAKEYITRRTTRSDRFSQLSRLFRSNVLVCGSSSLLFGCLDQLDLFKIATQPPVLAFRTACSSW